MAVLWDMFQCFARFLTVDVGAVILSLCKCMLRAICINVAVQVHAWLVGFLITSFVLLWCRYMLNWVKIRVWEQEQWDGVIMIDVDVTVLGDLTHLFKLPTDFAAVPDNGKVWNRYTCTFCIRTILSVSFAVTVASVSGQPQGALHMHCKLGHACSESLMQLVVCLYCNVFMPIHAWGKINSKSQGEVQCTQGPPYGVCLHYMCRFSKYDKWR